MLLIGRSGAMVYQAPERDFTTLRPGGRILPGSLMTIDEARTAVLSESSPLPPEEVPLAQAVGRVAAREFIASHGLPPFDHSAKDGFAVRSVDTRGATRESRVELSVVTTIPAGTMPEVELRVGQAAKIMTGAPLPSGADAVVKRELTQERQGYVTVSRQVSPGTDVRRAAEDVAAGQVALSAGTLLGPGEIGLLAGLGVAKVTVHRRPRVVIVPTGSELVEVDETPGPGQIHSSNAYILRALCAELGVETEVLDIVKDDREATRISLERGLGYDVLLSTGGVSVGDFDYVREVQEELGVQQRVRGVAMKPGRPLVFGVLGRCLVFGFPGNPAAIPVCFELLVRPAVLRLLGHRRVLRPVCTGLATTDMRGHKDMVRVVAVHASHDLQGWRIAPSAEQSTAPRGPNVTENGLAFIPAGVAGVRAGEAVEFVLTREPLE